MSNTGGMNAPKRLYLLAALALPALAHAEDVRDFAPDRPSRSDSPFTVPTNDVQIESDIANYTHPGDILQTLDPLLKYGVANTLDLELQIGGFINQRMAGVHASGFGDVVVRAKLNLLGDDGGDVTIALIPYLKIPTARAPIGNTVVEGGLNLPVLIALPLDFGLTIEPEISALKNTNDSGHQISATGVINLGRKIVGNLSGFVELYTQTYADHQAPGPQVTFDTGLSYLVTKTLQLDLGTAIGLNHASPSLNVYVGIAARF